MSIPHSDPGSISRKAAIAASLVALVLAGAAFAGWLDHGVEIFARMASDAWALCF